MVGVVTWKRVEREWVLLALGWSSPINVGEALLGGWALKRSGSERSVTEMMWKQIV